jgi:hypothetical protein
MIQTMSDAPISASKLVELIHGDERALTWAKELIKNPEDFNKPGNIVPPSQLRTTKTGMKGITWSIVYGKDNARFEENSENLAIFSIYGAICSPGTQLKAVRDGLNLKRPVST